MSKTNIVLAVALILLVGVFINTTTRTPDATPIIVKSGADTLTVHQNQIIRLRINEAGGYHLFCIYQFQFSPTAVGTRTTYWTPSGFFSEPDVYGVRLSGFCVIGLTLYKLTNIDYNGGTATFTKVKDLFGGIQWK